MPTVGNGRSHMFSLRVGLHKELRNPPTAETGQNSDYRQFLVRVISCDFVDRLLRSEKSDPRASHEITPTKSQGKLDTDWANLINHSGTKARKRNFCKRGQRSGLCLI
jgi:hypothetical protein